MAESWYSLMKSGFIIISPTVREWLEIIQAHRAELLNPRTQMLALLEGMRTDVDSQFDEFQSKWKPLRPYTIDKKTANDKDLRILHETPEGEGLRLREAYKKTGLVTEQGVLVWTYPASKPYAQELDKGGEIKISSIVSRGSNSKNIAKQESRLDKEYDRIFGTDSDDIFKKPRAERPKKKKKRQWTICPLYIMAKLPARPLEHQRFAQSKEAIELLKKKTLEKWSDIFKWKNNSTSADSQSSKTNVRTTK